ncbi:cytochrome P450 [Amycolatopsis sp. NPDC004368]
MRVHAPIGTWLWLLPGWWALALSPLTGITLVWQLLLFGLSAIAMRASICTVNDVVDKDIDAQAERTRSRPLPAGEVSVAAALVFAAVQLVIALALLIATGWLAVLAALASFPFFVIYPYVKRGSNFAQVWLGICFSLNALVGSLAATGTITAAALALWGGGVFWTIGYDTIYGHQDKEDDIRIGVGSTSLLFGGGHPRVGRWLLHPDHRRPGRRRTARRRGRVVLRPARGRRTAPRLAGRDPRHRLAATLPQALRVQPVVRPRHRDRSADRVNEPLLPFDRDVSPQDPPSRYAAWRAESPIRRVSLPTGRTYWLLTRFQDIRDVLAAKTVSADPTHADYPRLRGDDKPPRPGAFITSDPPEHTRLRRMVNGALRPAALERLQPALEKLTGDLLDDVATRPEFDLLADFALPLQNGMLCELLGVPAADQGLFERIALTISDLEATGEQVTAARIELETHLIELLDHKGRHPAEDLLSDLAVNRIRTGELTPVEAAGIGTLLLFAGQEPTVNTLTMSVLALMRDPEQARRLATEPDTVPRAVEELLRYTTVIHFGMRRVATEDLDIGGTVIRAGEGVICPLQSANRDETAFPEPDVLDLTRDARKHVAFGFGVHQCVGQPLARAELRVALLALFRRFPDLRTTVPIYRLAFRDHAIVYGPVRLPVTGAPLG